MKTALLRQVQPFQQLPDPVRPTANQPFAPHVKAQLRSDAPIANLAAGYQWAIVDVLVAKTVNAARAHGVKSILLAGGVAANALLRTEIAERADVPVIAPRMAYCTDNAAMIAVAGQWALDRGERSGLDLDVYARQPLAER